MTEEPGAPTVADVVIDRAVEAQLEAEREKRASRSRWRSIALAVLGLAVVGFTFLYVLPKVADYRDVWAVVSDLTWEWGLALAAATVLNIVTFAPPWMIALPGLGFVQAMAMTMASSAVAYVVPGGAAVGIGSAYAMLRSWGFHAAEVTRAVTLTGVWNQLANLLFPIVGLFLLTIEGETHALLTTAAFVGVAVVGVAIAGLVLLLYSERLAREIGAVAEQAANRLLAKVKRGPVSWSSESFVRFRSGSIGLVRRRWLWLTLATLVGNLAVFLVLVVSLRAVGVGGSEVSVGEAFAGWSLIRVLGMVPLTPGGIGVIELGLTGALVAFGGPNAEVVAAVLLYRVLTIVPNLVLGGLAVLGWQRLRPRARPSSQ